MLHLKTKDNRNKSNKKHTGGEWRCPPTQIGGTPGKHDPPPCAQSGAEGGMGQLLAETMLAGL